MKKAIRQIKENLKKNEDWIAWGFTLVGKESEMAYGMTAKTMEAWVEKHECEGTAVIYFARNIGMITNEEAWKIEKQYKNHMQKAREKARMLASIEERFGPEYLRDYMARHPEA